MERGRRGEARRNANADFSSMNISASQNPEAGFQYSGIHFRFFIRGGIFAAGVRSSHRGDRKLGRNRDVRRRGVTRQKIRDETDSGWRKRGREKAFEKRFHFILLYSYLLSDCPDFLRYSRKRCDPRIY